MQNRFVSIMLGSVLVASALIASMYMGNRKSKAPGDTLRLYCAAGIRKPVQEIMDAYAEAYGVEFETAFEGSGRLLTSIRADSGRGDIYIAADIAYIEDAQEFQLIDEFAEIAHQHPCIAIKQGNPKITKLEDLLNEDIKLSLAEPKVAAISRAAQKMLAAVSHEGAPIWDSLFVKSAVHRSTVNEVANDIANGHVDAGIIWDATAMQYDELKIVNVPEFQTSSKKIMAAVLKSSRFPTRALHFLRYMTSKQRGLLTFEKYGYNTIDGDAWSEQPEITLFTGGLMHPAIQESIQQFEKREGVTVLQVPNGCGILVAQINAGQHPDVYFACDTTFMERVKDVFPKWKDLSGTEMVLVTPKANDHNVRQLSDLTAKNLNIGLCDPDHSALGDLSMKLLQSEGIWESVKPQVKTWPSTAEHLVSGVVLGKLDAAIVYLANTTRQNEALSVFPLQSKMAKAVQPIAVAKDSPFPNLTNRFVQKLRSKESRRSFESLGFRWLDE